MALGAAVATVPNYEARARKLQSSQPRPVVREMQLLHGRRMLRPNVLLGPAFDGAVRPTLAALNEGCSASRASSQEGEPGRTCAAFRRTTRRRMPSAPPRGLCRLQHPDPGEAGARLRSWAGRDRPVVGDTTPTTRAPRHPSPATWLPDNRASSPFPSPTWAVTPTPSTTSPIPDRHISLPCTEHCHNKRQK